MLERVLVVKFVFDLCGAWAGLLVEVHSTSMLVKNALDHDSRTIAQTKLTALVLLSLCGL